MMSLFRGWPINKLAQIYTYPIVPDAEICEITQRIFISPQKISNILRRTSFSQKTVGRKKPPGKSGLFVVSACAGVKPGFKYRLRDKIVSRLRPVAFLMPYKLSDELVTFINDFQPEVIYSMLYDVEIMSLVIDISDRFGLPVVPHFMDDWPSTVGHRNISYRVLRPFVNQALKETMKRSPVGMVIGDAMAVEYKKRYGIEMIPFMYCIEPDKFNRSKQTADTDEVVRFVYIGGLHLNRWEPLREIGAALEQLAVEGVKTECLIYTHPFDREKYLKKFSDCPAIRIEGSLGHDEVPQAQCSADCLIHIESFNPAEKAFTHLSVSSKIPEYMAAGRPIFAYGPDDAASIRYIGDIGCGFIVDRKDTSLLKQKIKEAATSPILRRNLGILALKAAESLHCATLQRAKFRKTIHSAIKAADSALN